ncbi:MAG: MBL fold metallo-hydrolase [Deltaproteobacteria bacterium]|nr:MBL fold metallo-hydrolase [Deltaproteobacteria bacterium]
MGNILDLSEALWKGETDTYAHHCFGPPYGLERVADGTWFYKGFANTILRETVGGLVIVDPGAFFDCQIKFDKIRKHTSDRLNTAIFTHGHTDHVFGVDLYADEARLRDWPMPRVIAHEAMPARFLRYRESHGWNEIINGRQFMGGSGRPEWPVSFYDPDITYRKKLDVDVGGVKVLLRHARGETDDHTWVFFPDTRVLCTGDLFIYAVPNAGNPQKVQRYCMEWAIALREMAALGPEVLAPGHGFLILGADRVARALTETADLLESLHEQTIAAMNRGASLDEVIHSVKAPDALLKRPYLKPIYDEPEFIVRNIWRLYGGWYDGSPSHLKPAPEKDQAIEVARLAGGAETLARRAEELLEAGDFRLACHLADWAHLAAPDNPEVRKTAGRIYGKRAEAETSTMAMGIYLWAAGTMGELRAEGVKDGPVIRLQSGREKMV